MFRKEKGKRDDPFFYFPSTQWAFTCIFLFIIWKFFLVQEKKHTFCRCFFPLSFGDNDDGYNVQTNSFVGIESFDLGSKDGGNMLWKWKNITTNSAFYLCYNYESFTIILFFSAIKWRGKVYVRFFLELSKGNVHCINIKIFILSVNRCTRHFIRNDSLVLRLKRAEEKVAAATKVKKKNL